MSLPTKPTSALYNGSDQLGTNPGIIAGLLAGTGTPTDDVTGASGAYTTDNGGTATPAWATDVSGNALLRYAGGTVGAATPGTDKELHFASKGIRSSQTASGVTFFAAMKPATNGVNVSGVPIAARSADFGMLIESGPSLAFVLGQTPLRPSSTVTLDTTNTWGLIVTLANVGSDVQAKFYAYNFGTSTASTVGTNTITNHAIADYMNDVASDAVVNMRLASSTWCLRADLYIAGYAKEAWNTTKVAAFWADPWEAIRAAGLVAGTLTLATVGTSSLGFSLSTPLAGTQPYGPLKWYESTVSGFTPGSGNLISTVASPTFPATLTRTSVPANTPRFVVATVTDSAGTPATVSTPQVGGVCYPVKKRGYCRIGQSHTGYMPNPTANITSSITDLYPAWIDVNAGYSGSQTSDWLPTGPTVGGYGGKTALRYWLDACVTAWTGQSLDEAIFRLEFGVNDARASVSASTLAANLTTIINAIKADTALLALNIPTIRFVLLSPIAPAINFAGSISTGTHLETTRSYLAALKGLDNRSDILYLGDDLFDWTLNHATLSYYESTGIHLTQAATGVAAQSGYAVASQIEASCLERFLGGYNLPASSSGTFNAVGRGLIL